MTPLFQHQTAAIEKFYDKQAIPLFFSPGLGKTRTALEIAKRKFQNGELDCLLVVAPNKVHVQWAKEEIPKWLSDIPYYVTCKKPGRTLQAIAYIPQRLNICCVNIDQFSSATASTVYIKWCNSHNTGIILDEATRIKNPKAKRTQRLLYSFSHLTITTGRSAPKVLPLGNMKPDRCTVRSIEPATKMRIVLTGTPVTNGPTDVWSIMEFVKPGFWSMSAEHFKQHFVMQYMLETGQGLVRVPLSEEVWTWVKHCDSFEKANATLGVTLAAYQEVMKQDSFQGPYMHLDELNEKLKTIAMFVNIEDCLDMPDRLYIKRKIEMSKEQEGVYLNLKRHLIAQYHGKDVTAANKVVAYIRLQQIASGFVSTVGTEEDPARPEITYIEDCSKIDQLKLEMESLTDQQVIIVTHFSAEASLIYDTLSKDYSCCLLTGWKRVGNEEDFKSGKYQVMIANIRVISMGFNFQNCHTMIFYSNTFSLEDRIQVEARIYRAGQTHKCTYIDLVTEGTIEEKILDVLQQKKSLQEYIQKTNLEDFIE